MRINDFPQAANRPRLLLGMPVRMVAFLGGIALGAGVATRIVWMPALLLPAALWFAWNARSDPAYWEVYVEYTRGADRYVPWPGSVRRNVRPQGFGNGAEAM